MCRNTFRRTSLVDRNSFRAPRGGAMLLRSSSWRPKFISGAAWGRDVVAVVLLETEIHFGRRAGARCLLRSSSWRPKFISGAARGRDVVAVVLLETEIYFGHRVGARCCCGRPLGDRNSFRASRGGRDVVAVVLLETEIYFGHRVGARCSLRSSSWRPKFISVIAWGRDVRCGRPLGDRNSFRSPRGGQEVYPCGAETGSSGSAAAGGAGVGSAAIW
jgi:hypothetical protein